jgi:predicted nucleic acid-binding protein
MKLIDANIVIYALGQEHPLKGPSSKILEQIYGVARDYSVDAEAIQEILHVFNYRRQKQLGIEIAQRLIVGFGNVIPVGTPEVSLATHLFDRYPRLQPRDAIHAAVVMTNGFEGIISADQGFDSVTGLRRFDPREEAASL